MGRYDRYTDLPLPMRGPRKSQAPWLNLAPPKVAGHTLNMPVIQPGVPNLTEMVRKQQQPQALTKAPPAFKATQPPPMDPNRPGPGMAPVAGMVPFAGRYHPSAPLPIPSPTPSPIPSIPSAGKAGWQGGWSGYLPTITGGAKYTLLGGPDAHAAKPLTGWQSDNAFDLGMPVGTPIYAAESGVIGNKIGIQPSRPNDGSRLTLIGKGQSFWYGHMSKLVVKAGQKVVKGQLLGYSGQSANGAAHLHVGFML